jgi:hypothetical protein
MPGRTYHRSARSSSSRSESGWGDYTSPRVCAGCGHKLTLGEPGGLWFSRVGTRDETVWHHRCYRNRVLAGKA